tara:strand:- start:38 stop:550 length:513 start_codon:yes stop_codon:yes gene_type:complete
MFKINLNKKLLISLIILSFFSSIGNKHNNVKSKEIYNLQEEEISESNSEPLKEIRPNFIKSKSFGKLLPVMPDKESKVESSSITGRNPFTALGSYSSGISGNFPKDIRFTGITKVGNTKGILISSYRGIEVIQLGEIIANGYKVIEINTNAAKIKMSNGLDTQIVQLENP